MNTTAGAIRLTTARASCPASAASQPGIRRTRIARPQAARFTVWPRPGVRCPGRAVASSTPSISSRWNARWLGG